MISELRERHIYCPYCAELIDILIDDSIPHQSYIEDCQVCCRPINIDVAVDSQGDIRLSVSQENE